MRILQSVSANKNSGSVRGIQKIELLTEMREDWKIQWQKCLEIIRDNIGEERFKCWFSVADAIAFENDSIVISLPSHFFYEKFEDEFSELIALSLKRVFERNINIGYSVRMIGDDRSADMRLNSTVRDPRINSKLQRSLERPVNPLETEAEKAGRSEIDSQLNPAYNFENYCVGQCNRVPFAMAEYIANNPKKVDFNPFFIYGDVGVGKTHLIQAVGTRIKQMNPRAKVVFTPMRLFQNMYANATIKHQVPAFISWFQNVDVLLIDDVQELASKSGTMDVLFPIFNSLQQNGKLLLFTSDRAPSELDGVTDRLIDRFKWGVVERLPKPDFELRRQILKMKSAKNGLQLPDNILDKIARASTGSVRELEGIVLNLLTHAIRNSEPLSEALVDRVMQNFIKVEPKKAINFDMIIECTADYFHLRPDVIFSKSRVRDIADARQVIMYLASKHTSLSSPAIGQKLGRVHATVLHGISTIKDRLPVSRELQETVSAIETELFR